MASLPQPAADSACRWTPAHSAQAKTPPFCAPQVSSKTSSQILKGCAAVMLPPIQLSHCRSSGPRETAPRAFASTGGGIVEKEATIHVSNVALLDPSSDKATRVGFKTLEDSRKVRFAKASGEVID